MSRRKISCRLHCTYEGCKEFSYYECDNRDEYARISKKRDDFKCLRHTGNETLTLEHPERTVTLTVEVKPYGSFWDGKSGFAHGNGYRAYAEDFPPGTKLVVTAKLVQS